MIFGSGLTLAHFIVNGGVFFHRLKLVFHLLVTGDAVFDVHLHTLTHVVRVCHVVFHDIGFGNEGGDVDLALGLRQKNHGRFQVSGVFDLLTGEKRKHGTRLLITIR